MKTDPGAWIRRLAVAGTAVCGMMAGPLAAEEAPVDLDRTITVEGTIHIEDPVVHQGEPTSAPVPKELPKLHILKLAAPLQVKGLEQAVTAVQLGQRKAADPEQAKSERVRWNFFALKGTRVRVVGRLWAAETGHHKTPVLMDVEKLEPVPEP